MSVNAAKCVPFEAKKVEEEEQSEGAMYQFGTIVCAMGAIWLKMKLVAWLGVFLAIASVATRKTTEFTLWNIASSVLMAVTSLFMVYVAAQRQEGGA